ncbi:hypothetical protein AB0O75_34510 [Streptomyces sp. NPDC088921]|uniref:hypothetical protein n=1 Tax=unclassified Streptomyces TaxID=2593676 RepID=UPI0034249CF6
MINGNGVGRRRRMPGLVIADREQGHGKVTGSRGQSDSESKGAGEGTNGMGNSGRT